MIGLVSCVRKRMLKSKNKVIVISMGDIEGIGPEVSVKALLRPDILKSGHFIITGDKRLIPSALRKSSRVSIVDVPYRNPAEGSLKFLNKAIDLIKGGCADALVTAPLSKERVAKYYKNFSGHTEYLAQAFDVKHVDMMFVANNIRCVIVTRHEPLKDIPTLITPQSVYACIAMTHQSLVNIFKIKKPTIAVLGLNPHAGENGLMGKDELRAINPAINKALKQGWHVKGAFPADTFFYYNAKNYDAVIAMYHDQGLIPVKTLYSSQLVNMTVGLPFVRTCPAHGTAFDIAGKNKADPSSMVASLRLACQLA